MMILGTLSGVTPVVRMNGTLFGGGKPGPVARVLQRAYNHEIVKLGVKPETKVNKNTGKPFGCTYFKDATITVEQITDEILSLLEFRNKLKALGHFRTIYQNTNDWKFQFKNQLEKVLPNLR